MIVDKRVNLKEIQFAEAAVILIDKDLDWTSFDVVKKLKKILVHQTGVKKLKVGHAGTLDPLASGLLIVCTGRATKQIDSFQGMPKEYIATVRIGTTTPSFDLETEVNESYPTDHITMDLIEKAVQNLIGEQMQEPPIFSAKWIDGKRAYDLARAGKEAIMKKNLISIYEVEILNYHFPDLTLRIKCSKGTYIRSIARDLGEQLISGAHLVMLKRTKIGDFDNNFALSIKEFEDLL